MKRILAMALSLILCLSLSVPAFAAESADTAGDAVYLAVDATGEELAVELIAATEITDGLVTITYDPTVVSLGEADYTVSGKVTMHSVNASEEGTVKISWISADAVTGTLFTFDFSKAEGAEISADTFGVSGTATDEDGNTLTVGVDVDTVDKTVLESLVEAGGILTEESYTEGSWAAYEEALIAAGTVLNDSDATQEEVDEALTALANAIAALELEDTSADKTALQALYSSSLLLAESSYTEESWAAFSAELAEALAVLENADATQEETDAAFNELLAVIAALEPVSDEVNMEALLLVYEASLKLTEDSWTTGSWATLEDAQTAALAVLNDEDATQEEVDAALATLTDAIAELTAAANKEALDTTVTAAAAYEESSYTADSWTAFEEALAAAEAVLNDGNATQEEVDAALAALVAAEEGLTLKTASTGGDDNTGTSGDDSTGTSGDDSMGTSGDDSTGTSDDGSGAATGGTTTGTGDSAPVVLFSIIAVFAAATIVILLAAKKKTAGQQ
ncbi:MAG: hypothetical protein LUE29_06590 [Lachnospiraceae bacterium]|nr:hypothetical protein [Lachnospiraceae bacterium]